MRNRPTDFYVYIVIALFALVVMVYSLTYEFLTAKALPLALGGVILVLSSIKAIAAFPRKTEKTEVPKEHKDDNKDIEKEESEEFTWREYLPTVAWLTGYFVGVFLLGFMIASPLFIAAYMKTRGSRWLQIIIVAAAADAAMYGLFTLAFNIDLYGGLLFGR